MIESWPTGQLLVPSVRPSDPFVPMSRARAHLIYPLGTILIPNKRQSDRPFARHILSDRLVRPTDPSARLMGLASWAVRATDPSARPARPLDRLVRPTAPSARRTCPPEHPLQQEQEMLNTPLHFPARDQRDGNSLTCFLRSHVGKFGNTCLEQSSLKYSSTTQCSSTEFV